MNMHIKFYHYWQSFGDYERLHV